MDASATLFETQKLKHVPWRSPFVKSWYTVTWRLVPSEDSLLHIDLCIDYIELHFRWSEIMKTKDKNETNQMKQTYKKINK